MLKRTSIDKLQGHLEIANELNRVIDYINNMAVPEVDGMALDRIVADLDSLEAEVKAIKQQTAKKKVRKK